MLDAFPKILHLSLPQVYLSPSGSKILGEILANAPCLKSIDLHLAQMSIRAWEVLFGNFFEGIQMRIHLALNQEPFVENLTVMASSFGDNLILVVDDVPDDVLSTALDRRRKQQNVCSTAVAVCPSETTPSPYSTPRLAVDVCPPQIAPLHSLQRAARTRYNHLSRILTEDEHTGMPIMSPAIALGSVRQQNAQKVMNWCYNRGWLDEDERLWKLLAMIQRGLIMDVSSNYLTCSYHNQPMHTFDSCLHHFCTSKQNWHGRETPSLDELAKDIRENSTSVLQRYSG